MPITFLIDPHSALVRTTYVGLVTLADLSTYVRLLAERDLLKRAQLIDARQAMVALSPEDIRIIAELMTTLRERHGRAPVAFVPGNEVSYRVAETYADLGAGANPRFATFTDVAAAETWLAIESP
jgi:hypothetical protein